MTDEEIGNVCRLVGSATTQTPTPVEAARQLLAASIVCARLWSKMSEEDYKRWVEQLWPQIRDIWQTGGKA